jgi:hypothetical protein
MAAALAAIGEVGADDRVEGTARNEPVPAAPCRFACRADEIHAPVPSSSLRDRGDKPVTEEGDAAVAIKLVGWAVVR